MRPLLLLACAIAAAAVEVEVTLGTGETRYGTLLSEDADEVVIDRLLWSVDLGAQRQRTALPRSRIRSMQPVPSLAALHRDKAKAAGDEFVARYALARWCLEHGLRDEAFAHARALHDRDPDDAIVHELMASLGYLRHEGAWMRREDFAARHGLVRYGGELMSPAEADARRAAAAAKQLARAAAERIDAETGARARILEQLRDATVALDRSQRLLRRQRQAEEAERRRGMTEEQIQDERRDAEVAAAFDAEHGIERAAAEPATEPDDLVEARREHERLAKALARVRDDIAAAKAELATHTAAFEQQWKLALTLAVQRGATPEADPDPLVAISATAASATSAALAAAPSATAAATGPETRPAATPRANDGRRRANASR